MDAHSKAKATRTKDRAELRKPRRAGLERGRAAASQVMEGQRWSLKAQGV